jgi:fused signal recognition particle receptor
MPRPRSPGSSRTRRPRPPEAGPVSTSWQEILDLGAREAPQAGGHDAEEGRDERRGVLRRLRESLSRSRQALSEEISASLFDRIDEQTWERLEEALIFADVGAPTTAQVVEGLEREVESGEIGADGAAIRERLIEMLAEIASTGERRIDLAADPAVLLMVGVNGTGKTTTIGKIAWHLNNEFGLDVVLGAADTYRAAAAEQLAEWANRAGTDLVRSAAGADPGAVAFDAIAAARARSADVVIIDTAGRLHTQGNLMDELAKVRRVIGKQIPEAPHETLITIDATTGQNGLRQAKVFSDSVALDGVVLTKLDGTAKGGITLAIASELGIPVKLIGTGEGLEDLRPFDPLDFSTALLGE